MQYVIVRTDHGRREFLSDPSTNGTGGSYSPHISNARRFSSLEAAQRECCDNETPAPLDNYLGRIEP